MNPDPVLHVALPEVFGTARTAACGAPDSPDVITWAEAMHPLGRHFTCVECHKVISAGERHRSPQ